MPSYGRGGAGNIAAVNQENERIDNDLEANQAAAESVDRDFVPPPDIARDEQKYAHSGRGGAGNYYSPGELDKTGAFSDAHRSHIPGDGTLAPSDDSKAPAAAPPSYSSVPSPNEVPRKTGRGGAGNYDFGINEWEQRAAKKRWEEDQKQQKLKEDIEKGVKQTLAFPEVAKTKVPGGEPY